MWVDKYVRLFYKEGKTKQPSPEFLRKTISLILTETVL